MKDFKNMRAIIMLIAMMFLLSLVYTLLTGCTRTVKNVATTHDTIVEVHFLHDTTNVQHTAHDTVYVGRRDTIRTYRVYHDSIEIRDSVFVREKGDSVYVYKERWRTRVDIRHDTVYKAKADTVYKCITDTQYVYRSVASADSLKQSSESQKEVVKEKRFLSLGRIIGIAALCGVVFLIIWVIRRFGTG